MRAGDARGAGPRACRARRLPAPGAPGAKTVWTRADKDGFGTAVGGSRVWFTLSRGELTEVYYPRLDTPSVRDLELVVSDGRTFAGAREQVEDGPARRVHRVDRAPDRAEQARLAPEVLDRPERAGRDAARRLGGRAPPHELFRHLRALSSAGPWTADGRPGMESLEHIPRLTFGDPAAGNTLICGHNLVVLDRIGGDLTGAVRCIYIDPPYNNSERYTHYDDRAGHDAWLDGMEAALRALAPLLRGDGSLWISIDDTEVHHLKVLADRVLGRASFVATVVWEHRTTRENRRVFSPNHEYVLVYAKDPERFKATRNPVGLSPEILARYRNPDGDPRGPWQSVSLNAQAGHGTPAQFYEVVAPNGHRHRPPKGRCWIYAEDRMRRAIEAGEVWFGADGHGVPRLKRFLSAAPPGMTPPTLWTSSFAGTTGAAKRHSLRLFPDERVFDTPKPEELLRRIVDIATDPGDLVLDAYLGSGTTAAVAHKLGRRWIGIEIGEHAVSHCLRRLRQVVDGERGGISHEVGWTGGGGFRFHDLREEVERAA